MLAVDPSAKVAPGAVIGADVKIGPYCVIGPNVALGDGCELIAHVHLAGGREHRRPVVATLEVIVRHLALARAIGVLRRRAAMEEIRRPQQRLSPLEEADVRFVAVA